MYRSRRTLALLAGTALVGSGLVGLNAPAAAAPAELGDGQGAGAVPSPAATTWEEPVPGTSAEIEFDDAMTSARAASMSPYLAEIVRGAERVRTVEIGARTLHRPLAAESVAIELFDGVTVDLQTNVALSEGVAAAGSSSRVYAGGGEDGTAILTLIDGDLHGAVWKDATRYGIEPLGGGRHLVYEDGRTFPDAHPAEQEAGVTGASPAAAGGPGTLATTVIDIMIAYDDSAVDLFGSVAATEAEIVEMVNTTNQVFANSQNDVEFALTNILDLEYTRNAAHGTLDDRAYWDAIKNQTDGIVDHLYSQRDTHGADLAAIITDATDFCGTSRFPTNANPAETAAVSLTDGECALGELSFPHEIGHNLCANHDPENAGGNPCGTDSYGHFSKADGLRTVMSYDERFIDCPGCERIPFFSNPGVTEQGWTTGILGERDNSRVVGMWAPDIAAYRTPPTAGPCEVDYTITNTWSGNVQVDLVVHNNTTTQINGWTAEWTFTGDENVYNSWGVAISQTGADVTAVGDGWGVTIPAGGSITVGFQATVSGTPTVAAPISCAI